MSKSLFCMFKINKYIMNLNFYQNYSHKLYNIMKIKKKKLIKIN